FSSRRRHTRFSRDWSSDVCSSDLPRGSEGPGATSSENRRRPPAPPFQSTSPVPAWPSAGSRGCPGLRWSMLSVRSVRDPAAPYDLGSFGSFGFPERHAALPFHHHGDLTAHFGCSDFPVPSGRPGPVTARSDRLPPEDGRSSARRI